MAIWRLAAASVVVSNLMGCAAERALPKSHADIVLGEASREAQDGVLLVRGIFENELVCSAALVAPNLLLTAQHCVSYVSEGPFSCNARGELVDNPQGGGTLGLSVPAELIEVYDRPTPRRAPIAHGAEIISTHSANICQNDLAFVRLDRALDLPIVPLRVGRSAVPGELGVLVGYGLVVGQRGIDYRTQERAQKRDLQIAEVGPDSLEDGVTTVPPRTIILNGPSGCVGDSGGPLLSQSTGALLGVYSLQQAEACDAPNVLQQLVHVPPFQLLIDEAFAAAGAEPLLEAAPVEDAGIAGSGNEAGAAGAPTGTEPELTAPRKDSGCALGSLALRQDPNLLVLVMMLFASRRRER